MGDAVPGGILIVDDESVLTAVLAEVFDSEGFTVRTAPNGAIALNEHTRDPADIILSDVMMPVLDGLALIGALRERGDSTPVILMSAASHWVTATPDIPIVRKPFDINDVVEAVRAIVPPGD
jgi:DNA-binding response OmpR family regulator